MSIKGHGMQDVGLRIRDAKMGSQVAHSRAPDGVTTIGDVVDVLRRQFVPLFLCTLLSICLGLTHYLTTPKQYYASATILVDERPNQLPEELDTGNPFVRNDTSLLNELQVLKSLTLATAVVRQTNLHEQDAFVNPPSSFARSLIGRITGTLKSFVSSDDPVQVTSNQQGTDTQEQRVISAASRLQRQIGIERNGRSFSVNISYVGHDPALSAQVVNAYADAYLADHRTANLESSERTAEWMRSRLAELQQRAAEVSTEATLLRQTDPTQVDALRDLAQQAANLDALHQTISIRYEQIGLQGSFPVTNGRVLTRSIVPTSAAFPKPMQTIATMAILGLILGFMIAVLREMNERAFRVGVDVFQDTGHQFLGYLPQIRLGALPQSPPPQVKQIILSNTAATIEDASTDQTGWAAVKSLAPKLFWSVLAPPALFHETLHNMQIAFDTEAARQSHKVLGISSMGPGEGGYELAANHANKLAKSGRRTILIDLDVEVGALSRALKLSNGAGLAEVLQGMYPLPQAIHTMDYTGLHVLPCNPDHPGSLVTDMVYQENLTVLMAELRSHYDDVIVNMPPLGNAFSAKAVARHLDKITMVCEWGKTPRSLVTQYLAHDVQINQKILGIVLANVDMRKIDKYARPGLHESRTIGDPVRI